MEENMGEVNLPNENPLKQSDRRNNTILLVVGILLFVISLYGSLSGTDYLPTMWGELLVIIVLGLFYQWAIRRHRVDLRLGLVYSAVGIVVSFILLTIGLLLSIMIMGLLPFLEGSNFSFLALIPFGLCVLLLHKYLHRISLKAAEKQWTRMNEESMFYATLPLQSSSLYLAGNKWTDLGFYIFLYMIIELLPIVLGTVDLATSFTAILLVLLFMIQTYSIYKTQKKSKSDFIS